MRLGAILTHFTKMNFFYGYGYGYGFCEMSIYKREEQKQNTLVVGYCLTIIPGQIRGFKIFMSLPMRLGAILTLHHKLTLTFYSILNDLRPHLGKVYTKEE
jgi:hypothetical protein